MDEDLIIQWQDLTCCPVVTLSWTIGRNGQVPEGAVVGGTADGLENTYIGRVRLEENDNRFVPGVVIPSKKFILVSYGTGVRSSKEYEVLVSTNSNSFEWVASSSGAVPPNAVIGGFDCSYHEPVYVGRTCVPLERGRTWRGQRLPDNGMVQGPIPGKVHCTHKCLYVPIEGKEYLFREYEVLALKCGLAPLPLKELCRNAVRNYLLQNSTEINGDVFDFDKEMMSKRCNALPLPTGLKQYCVGS